MIDVEIKWPADFWPGSEVVDRLTSERFQVDFVFMQFVQLSGLYSHKTIYITHPVFMKNFRRSTLNPI